MKLYNNKVNYIQLRVNLGRLHSYFNNIHSVDLNICINQSVDAYDLIQEENLLTTIFLEINLKNSLLSKK